jgi:glucosamine kinase
VAYYLGIDGGGSKTTCAVGDEKSLLATVVAGPSNITRVGESRARESLQQAIRRACEAAGITPDQVLRVCVGAAGAGRAEIAATVRRIVAEILPGELSVIGDMPIALEAAFGSGPGVVVVAGTGSFAYGRNTEEETARAGGWGFAISDEGSAHWIGRGVVHEVLRAKDRSDDASPLLDEFMQAFGVQSFDEFIRAANSNPDFEALFPVVTKAADDKNPAARKVLTDAALELAQLAAVVIRRLFSDDGSIPVAIAGGVFRHSTLVRESFSQRMHDIFSSIELRPGIVEPVYGALELARRERKSLKEDAI